MWFKALPETLELNKLVTIEKLTIHIVLEKCWRHSAIPLSALKRNPLTKRVLKVRQMKSISRKLIN